MAAYETFFLNFVSNRHPDHQPLGVQTYMLPYGAQALIRLLFSAVSEQRMGVHDAKTQRKNALKRDGRYGENGSGKWVRMSAFREIDYDPSVPWKLREFDCFDDAFAFNEDRRLDGTGGRKAKTYSQPKQQVPKEQLALRPATSVPAAAKKRGAVMVKR